MKVKLTLSIEKEVVERARELFPSISAAVETLLRAAIKGDISVEALRRAELAEKGIDSRPSADRKCADRDSNPGHRLGRPGSYR